MGKVFRVLGILVGILVVLVLVAVVVLPMVIDPNDYKEEIVAKVNEETGRRLSIEGDLKLSVFPWLGVEIGKMELSNAEGFGEKPFAAVSHAAVHVKLMPLLSRQLEVSSLELDGLQLNLARAESGRTNWDDLAVTEGEPPPATEGEKEGVEMAVLTVGGIDISDARISWDDQQAGQAYTIDRFNLQAGAIMPGQPVDLSLNFALNSKVPAVDADFSLTGRVRLDEAAGNLSVDSFKVTVDAKGEVFPAGAIEAELTAGLDMSIKGEALTLSDLKLALGDLRMTGELKGADLDRDPKINGKLAVSEFNMREWMSSINVTPPETADPAVLTRVSGNMVVRTQDQVINLQELLIVLDDTMIKGGASVKGDAVSFKVDVDAIDADRYLPPSQEGAAKTTSETTGDEELLPMETLRGLNITGVVNIGRLVINKLQAEGVSLTVNARNGLLELDQKINKFYEGNYKGKVSVDARNKSPNHKIGVTLSGVSAGPLLQDLVGEDRLVGKGRFNADLNSSGNSVNAIRNALAGNLEFEFSDGAVKGINVAQILRETRARFQGQAVPQSKEPLQTDFSKLSGSGVIQKGILTNRDLLAMTPFLRVTGAGAVDLVKESLDYKIKPVVVATAKGQGGEGLEDLSGVEVPVHLTGPWASPSYGVDWGTVLVSSQKGKIEEKIQEKIKEKLPLDDKLQDTLKGLFR